MGAAAAKVFVVVPVFERLEHTLACVTQLEGQTYPNLEIVIVDGGSRDGSLETLERLEGITLISHVGEQWWTGATWYGVDHALKHGGDEDFVLLLNDDTVFDSNFVGTLVSESRAHRAAVSAAIVDAEDPGTILDAGVTIDWRAYAFTARRELGPDEFNSDVDTLEGRGAIVPISMIRDGGTVDPARLPHYAGDFEFFCRLKGHGHRLGVTGRARLGAHQATTGILPTAEAVAAGGTLWAEVTSRRSTTNLRDHLNLVGAAAPPELRPSLRRALILEAITKLATRTPTARRLGLAAAMRVIRMAAVFVLRPYPFTRRLAPRSDIQAALDAGLVERIAPEGWYGFRPRVSLSEVRRLRAGMLWLRAWNPLSKVQRWRAFNSASVDSESRG